MSVTQRLLSAALAAFLIGLLSASACYMAAGPTLGLFLGGLLTVTILTPPCSLAQNLISNRLIAALSLVIGVSIVWLFGTLKSDTLLSEWASATFVLAAYAIALTGVSTGFALIRISPIVSAALTVVFGLAWMTWPIWASRTWDGSDSEAGVARLVIFHPGMAINAQVSKLGAWSGQSVAYHLTDLQQNVPYTLPHNFWPCVLLHAILGGALLYLAAWVAGRGVAVKTCPSIVQTAPSATTNSPT